MAPKTTKRRSPHEGGAYSYQTKAGILWYWKATVAGPDGTAKPRVKRGFTTKQAALAGLREALSASSKGGYAEPSKQTLADYLADVARRAAARAVYRRQLPEELPLAHPPAHRLGAVGLLTPVTLDKLYVTLERDGRADHRQGEGLRRGPSGTSTRSQLGAPRCGGRRAAARQPGQPGAPAHRQAGRSPEMHPWTAGQLNAFLGWAGSTPSCRRLARAPHTGMRRGELLGLRWRDIDLDAATVTVRRSAGLIRAKGEGAAVIEGPTKSGKPRVVDLDPATVAVLRAWKRERGTLALVLAKDDALVFGDIKGITASPSTSAGRGPTWPARSATASTPADPAS